jgi:hypothetical protein
MLYLIEPGLSLRLKVADNDPDLPHVLDRPFEVLLQVFEGIRASTASRGHAGFKPCEKTRKVQTLVMKKITILLRRARLLLLLRHGDFISHTKMSPFSHNLLLRTLGRYK